MSQEARGRSSSGFQGAIDNLPLADLLQVWGLNRFSGLVTVQNDGRAGHLYFVDGDIVHADADGLEGEPAVRVVLGWSEGQFDLAPNTTTLKRTIQKSVSHLLLEAHRQLDEQRRDGGAAPAARPPVTAPPNEPARRSVLDGIRALHGVKQVVRFGDDGRPVGSGAPEAEALAASGLYLALTHATVVRSAFGFGELGLAALQNARQGLVLVRGSPGFLAVALEPGVALYQIVAQIRALLTRPAAR